jgi:transposase
MNRQTNGTNRFDARRLSAEAQEDLRRRAVRAVVEQEQSQTDVARTFGVSRMAVHKWVKTYRRRGPAGLKSKPQGRPKRSRLAGHEAATTVRLITKNTPDRLGLPFALWTREAVRQLLAERFGLEVSVWTVGRYLKRWGLTPQKPIRRAYEQDPKAVRKWLEEDYPAIRRQAQAEGAQIHWGDQMGLRSDHQTGTSYGRKGQTPVVGGTGKRFRVNMISTLTNQGRMAFRLFEKNFTGEVMIDFLRRLLRHVGRRVFLIVDRHPVHRSRKVRRWVDKHHERIRLFFLPDYSPELNPDELLNQDAKSNALGRERPRNKSEMVDRLRSYLRSTQRQPKIVKSYFQHHTVNYAAA